MGFNLVDTVQATGGAVVKNPPANARHAGEAGWIPGLGRSPGEGNGNPLQYICLENPHGQRSLAGYSPWGHIDVTEHVCTHIQKSATVSAGPPCGLTLIPPVAAAT